MGHTAKIWFPLELEKKIDQSYFNLLLVDRGRCFGWGVLTPTQGKKECRPRRAREREINILCRKIEQNSLALDRLWDTTASRKTPRRNRIARRSAELIHSSAVFQWRKNGRELEWECRWERDRERKSVPAGLCTSLPTSLIIDVTSLAATFLNFLNQFFTTDFLKTLMSSKEQGLTNKYRHILNESRGTKCSKLAKLVVG